MKSFDEWPLLLRFAGAVALLTVSLLAVERTLRQTDPAAPKLTATPAATTLPTPAESVSASPQANAPLVLHDGGRTLTLDATGHLTGTDGLSAAEQAALQRALTTGQIEWPETLQALHSAAANPPANPTNTTDAAQSWSTSQALQSPVNQVLADPHPVFRWKPLVGASSYRVTITDLTDQGREVFTSYPRTSLRWSAPKPLTRGHLYRWQVTAQFEQQEIVAPTSNAPEVRFSILSQAQFNEMTRAQQKFADQHLPLALSYARLGLLREAEAELEALSAANLAQPAIQKLRLALRTQRQSLRR